MFPARVSGVENIRSLISPPGFFVRHWCLCRRRRGSLPHLQNVLQLRPLQEALLRKN